MIKMNRFMVYSPFGVLLCLLHVHKMTADCNSSNGPSGVEECVNLNPRYNGSQYATCLTNAYIQQKSQGRHICTDHRATYCWYQCMIEIHDVDPGFYAPVYDDCACGKNGSMTRPGSALPPWCLSPSGADCGWYRQCLEKQFPCEGTPVAYAITYAEKFCNLYTDHASNFSQIGQRWINAVRKCLQVELVPNLRSWANTSCEKIRRNAFDSHAKCYLSPTNGEPSICELPCQDYIQVICTVKSAFLSAKVEAIKGLIEAYRGCKKFDCLKLPNLALFVFKTFRERFSLQKSPTMEELDELAGAVADAIASKLGWRDSGVLWYAQSNYTNLTSIVSVEVLITGKGIYDLGSTKASNFNITAVTAKVVKAVKDGDLFLGKVGDQSEPMYVKQMKECADFECQRATQEITAPPNRFTSSAYDLRNNFMHTFLTLSFLSSLSYNFPNAYIP